MTRGGSVYILTNKTDTTLYIGVTANLSKRIWEHKNRVVDSFSSKYHVTKLVYYEVFEGIEDAIIREKYLKGKTRAFKINLINSKNPRWKDLSGEIV